MAFQGAGFDIIIDAVLTEVGKKRMAQGKFRVSKFSLGDDEIDYNLFDAESDDDEGYTQRLLTASVMEAGSTNGANILYGVQTFSDQKIDYFPVLKVNKAIGISTNPTLSQGLVANRATTASAYYVSVNEETTEKINEIFATGSFQFLESDDFTGNKIIVESGISERLVTPPWTRMPPDAKSGDYKTNSRGRFYHIISKGLYDNNYFIYCDKRLVKKLKVSDSCGSVFKNYPDGSSDINFVASKEVSKISYGFVYDNYECFATEGIPNLISDHGTTLLPPLNKRFSELGGPKGTVIAFNVSVDEELRTKSAGERNYRYVDLGLTDQYVFDKTNKFDYIDTNIHVEGAASRSSVDVPIRLIRYSGT